MASQNRHRSRGSLSILNHIRSLSRTGSRQERVPSSHERSPSSMSCNPRTQPAPSPGPILPSVSPVTAEGLIRSPTTALPQLPSAKFETPPPPYEKQPRVRPRSWISIPNALKGHTARSRSVHLTKEASDSTIGRSVISAPTLTGTSNAKVAQAEGVQCEDFRQQSLTWKRVQPQPEKPSRFSDIVRTIKNRRSKSMEVTTTNDGLLSVEKGVARRRAETVNLCKEKINKLTGHGHIRRKSMAETSTSRDGANPLLPSNTDQNFVGLDSSSDFGFGSLTRSFASAVDRLDFQPPQPPMALPKSRSSLFNFRKRDKDERVEEKRGIIEEEVKDTASIDEKLSLRDLLKEAARNRSCYPPITASDPEPTRFDASRNAYVPADPVANYPRGVNPLRMHTNPMEFASAPPGVELPDPQVTNKFVSIDEDEDVIEDAPIYSPSSGDLSQYNRLTPSPATVINEEEVDHETPTRMPGQKSYMQRLGLRRSKSGLGLFAKKKALGERDENQKVIKKSRSMHFGIFKKEEDVPALPEAKFQPVTPSPLRNVTVTPEPGFRRDRDLSRDVTNLERTKRQGVIGMPVEDVDEMSE